MMPATTSEPADAATGRVSGLDYVELFVGNARQTAFFYRGTLGLPVCAYAGFETGHADRSSYLLAAGDTRLVVSAPVSADGPIARYVNRHGDGVRDIAFAVDCVDEAFHRAVSGGATPVSEPARFESDRGTITIACVEAFGDVVHSLVHREPSGWWLPGLEPAQEQAWPGSAGVTAIDHFAVCAEEGAVDELVELYTKAFGFRESFGDYVATSRSAMRGRAVESPDGRIRLPLWEAGAGPRGSQVAEFVRFNEGAGVQHAAFLCENVIDMARRLRARGVDFLPVPASYYDTWPARHEELRDVAGECRALGIVIEPSGSGYLMQVFTRPLQSRPTFFWELIERRGSRGFSGDNIRALFEAVEGEQERRGTL